MKDELCRMKNRGWKIKASTSHSASVDKIQNGWRLGISGGDVPGYRVAQLDDYAQLMRRDFPHHSLTFSLHARASSDSIPGTWGFGLWNDPFGLSLGFGGNQFRLPALPNAVWFFHASPQNYLSFKDPSTMPPTNSGSAQGVAANGFLAQTFRAPPFHPLLIPAGLALPFSRKLTRRMLGKVIEEDEVTLNVDVTQWHAYSFEWSPKRVAFYVDQAQAFETPVSPHAPLGIVIWIDNQYAAFRPDGRMEWGVLEGKECWIEVEDIVIT
jgi:hypothetical protein